jgi:uncharacterized protein YndB with AHSA1/START domain
MVRLEESIDIDAPVETVFGAVTDPRRAHEWNTAIVEVSDVSDSSIGEGTTWRQVARYAGRTAKFQCRVAEYRPPHEGVLDISGDYEAQIVTVCESVARRTRLIQSIDFAGPSGLRGRMEMAVIQPIVRREMRQSMARLKEVLERETGAGSG